MQEFEFIDNRKALWFLGALVIVAGLLAAFLIVPGIGHPPEVGGPDIHLPKIGTLPPHDVPQIAPRATHP
jgi:hypothetical protein